MKNNNSNKFVYSHFLKMVWITLFLITAKTNFSQFDTTIKFITTNRAIKKEKLVKLFHDSIYTIYSDSKSLDKHFNYWKGTDYYKLYRIMRENNNDDFYNFSLIHDDISLNPSATRNLLLKNKCLIIDNKSLKIINSIIYKRYKEIKNNNYTIQEAFLINGHLLFIKSTLLK